ncbi:Kae1-like domain-containing protein [Geobacter pickeringii]
MGGYGGFRRAGHLRQVPLPGGDAAVREPFRMALAHLHDAFGAGLFDLALPWLAGIGAAERSLYLSMLERRINSPLTSSCGRLFDAVAALIGLRERVSYEGQAAIELEALAEESDTREIYPFAVVRRNGSATVDFRMMIRSVAEDAAAGRSGGEMARAFHGTVAAAAAEVCGQIRAAEGVHRVVLSGGVFQNRLLTEGVHQALTESGFTVFTHRLVPPTTAGWRWGRRP